MADFEPPLSEQDAERLLDGYRADSMPALSDVLAAAAAPASAEELAGLPTARERYLAVTGGRRRRRSRLQLPGIALARLAMAKVLLLVGGGLFASGVAVAAVTGSLPDSLQQVGHSIVPAVVPGSSHPHSTSPARSSHPAPSASAATSSSGAPGPTSSGSANGRTAKPTLTPPGRTRTPPGQTRTPPGQTRIPPGQSGTPPGQAKTLPGQAVKPGSAVTPPSQIHLPPGQTRNPAGQAIVPPGQPKNP